MYIGFEVANVVKNTITEVSFCSSKSYLTLLVTVKKKLVWDYYVYIVGLRLSEVMWSEGTLNNWYLNETESVKNREGDIQ